LTLSAIYVAIDLFSVFKIKNIFQTGTKMDRNLVRMGTCTLSFNTLLLQDAACLTFPGTEDGPIVSHWHSPAAVLESGAIL
jgi:hypothetical protein